jgi:hypothetical protein
MVDLAVPPCFAGFGGGSRSGFIRYNDLSTYIFSGPEKDYLVSQIICSDPNLRSIDAFDDTGKFKATHLLAKRYNINRRTVRGWIKINTVQRVHNHSTSGGRSLDIDPTSREILKAKIIEREEAVEPISVDLFNKIVLEQKVQSVKRKFLNPTADAGHISVNNTTIHTGTIASTKKACYFRDRAVQSLTDARLAAMSCIRLIYITAVMVWALARYLPKECKWNADCTTFICSVDNTGQMVVVFREKGDKIHRQVTSHLAGGELNLLVKYFLIGNAAGQLGDPCFIIAVGDKMPADEFYAEYVLGIANNDRSDQRGWIYFCSTKGGNAAMWHHWFKEVCIPCIKKASDLFDLKDPDGVRYRNFLSTDGEACILNEAFDPEVIALFQEASIDYLKLGPSATKIQQPADASDGFRDAKKGIKQVTKKGVAIESLLLRTNMTECFTRLGVAFPDLQMTAAFKEKIKYSLEVITFTLRQSYISGHKLSEGFRRVGQLVDVSFPLQRDEVTVDYDCMISQCLNQGLTSAEIENMKAQLPIVADRAIQEGMIN